MAATRINAGFLRCPPPVDTQVRSHHLLPRSGWSSRRRLTKNSAASPQITSAVPMFCPPAYDAKTHRKDLWGEFMSTHWTCRASLVRYFRPELADISGPSLSLILGNACARGSAR
jgi:hypothetical protein